LIAHDIDSPLVRRIKRGDAEALETLLRRHYDTVRAVCHRIVLNDADADDATQQALISIARSIPDFNEKSKVSTWVYRIAVNAALDEIRRTKRRAIPIGAEQFDNISSTVDDINAVNARIDIQRALEKVPDEFRVALVLRHVADMEYDDIAVVLDIPIGTVRSRLSRGREQLAQAMGGAT
jgi:RNA polymerase sigma-70 factor (ECF subfamily)